MTEKGDPYENAVAERVNGILKSEWIDEECLVFRRQRTHRPDRYPLQFTQTSYQSRLAYALGSGT
ncbi:MAG: hypothetical protein ACLSH3_05855 [Alistipes finegoldii]